MPAHRSAYRPLGRLASLLRDLPDTDLRHLSRAAQRAVASQTGTASGALAVLSSSRTRCAWVSGFSPRS